MGTFAVSGLVTAIGFNTRIPLKRLSTASDELAGSAPWFPIVGAGIGAIIATAYVGLSLLLPSTVAAVLAVSAGALLTGALHEDGLGDVADAFGGGWTVERRLEILDDHRQGTFGVITLTAAFLTRVSAMATLDTYSALALIPAAHALSRVPGIVLMRRQPLARTEGLAAAFAGNLTPLHEIGGIVIGVTIGALLIGPWVVAAVVMCALVSLGMTALARKKVGGIGGDVLGAVQQLSDLAVLLLGVAVAQGGWGSLPWWRP
ncbi:MAG: adenosylcobinamide-GDP ribazoletransferase [Actinomycetota bacterium]